MNTDKFTHRLRHLLLLAAGVAGLALSAPAAQAQDERGYSAYDQGPGYDRDVDYQSGSDELTVEAPRHHRGYSSIGAPIEDVAISRVVHFHDLDLRTGWGARELRARVISAADAACDDLDARYPVTEDGDSSSCRDRAARNGLHQARAAIAEARGYAGND